MRIISNAFKVLRRGIDPANVIAVRGVARATSAINGIVLFPVLLVAAVAARIRRDARGASGEYRIVWGSTPLINNVYWSRAMREAGFFSETFVTHFYSISQRTDFDRVLTEEYAWCGAVYKPYVAFLTALHRYDVFVTSFNGFMLTTTVLNRLQPLLFKVAGAKVVVIPFGSDSYVYSRIRSTATLQGLLLSYPGAAREQDRISRNVERWCKHADAVLTGVMGPDGFGRWDVPVASTLSIDLGQWIARHSYSHADGTSGVVRICHAPNHRGFKGTEFVNEAVRRLQEQGLNVELVLIEGRTNAEVRQILADSADILVEQLVFTGHAMNALEGMASGLPVICNLEDDEYLLPFRRWSYFGECPIVSATPENIEDVLRALVVDPSLREHLGQLGRQYVEKYHGLDSARFMFGAVLDFLYGRRATLSDLYHPLTSDYVRREPRILPPLHKNRLGG